MSKSISSVGGTAWINLVNTRYISDNQPIDLLSEDSSILLWLEENQLLRSADSYALRENKNLLNSLTEHLLKLRELCKLVIDDLEEQGQLSPIVIDQLKRLTEQVKINLMIDSESEDLSLVYEGVTLTDHVIYKIVQSVIQTLATASTKQIRKCEHSECRLYFVDTSKSGRRRWCSMELCGNRHKAANYYARKKKK